MARDFKSQDFTDEETARRRDELAKRMLTMPPSPLKSKSKIGEKANPPKKRGRPSSGKPSPSKAVAMRELK